MTGRGRLSLLPGFDVGDELDAVILGRDRRALSRLGLEIHETNDQAGVLGLATEPPARV